MTFRAAAIVTADAPPQVQPVLARRVVGVLLCAAACSSGSHTGPVPTSQGIVTGVVRDSAGRGIPYAKVCAATAVAPFGTPYLMTSLAHTWLDGSYVVRFNLDQSLDAWGPLTVNATPAAGSGLSPAYTSGDSVLITSAPPPSDTAHVDVVVPKGPAYSGIACVFGP